MELEKQLVSNKNILTLNKEHESILGLVKKELSLDKYNSIVTMKNYKDMKATGTELNKFSKFVNDFRKTKVKLETEDIEIFKSNCKIYDNLIQVKREAILKGLAVFEEETKKQVLTVCKEYLNTYCEEVGLREEFVNKINSDDMSLTGYMSATTGVINKKGRDEVEKRVNAQLSLQNKVDLRLSNLENECLKADIAILSKEHVQGFLMDDDTSYNAKLNALIEIEIKRANAEKKKIEEKAKAEAEKVAQEKVIADQKALKEELEARYQSKIKNATLEQLIAINIELKSYDPTATYELKQQATQREKDLEEQKKALENKSQEVNEEPQEQHLRDIAKEETWTADKANQERWIREKTEKAVNGKVLQDIYCQIKVGNEVQTISMISVKVPEDATTEQVISRVVKMIKDDKLPLSSFEMV